MKKRTAYEPRWLAKGERPTLRVDDGSAPADAPGNAPPAPVEE